MDFLNDIYNLILDTINSSSFYGPFLACFLIMIESILPILPLFVFITVIFITFGYFIGFIISYILTIVGCLISYYLVKRYLYSYFTKKFRKKANFNKLIAKIDNIKLSTLAIIVAIPFTPAFLINICAALSDMNFKKYFMSLIIGKVSLVFFWGFIGTSLVESLKNPKILIVILLLLVISYVASKIVTKKLDIE